jgi:Phosphoglycerate dehydrogenase and related dehydrogenases
MTERPIVLIPQDVPEQAKNALVGLGCAVRMGTGITEDALIADIGDADFVVARTAPYTRRVLEAARRLRCISRFGVGVDNIDLAAAATFGIWVANTPEANSATVAEHALAMMFACAIDLVNACNETKKGNFNYRNQVMGIDLGGKTLSIIGLGRIGRRLAVIAQALSMRVVAYDPFVPTGQEPGGVVMVDDYDQAFREADFLSLHLPLTENTRGSVGHREFALMKRSAYFVNCSRGEVVREADLIAALESGEIAGAAIDVFETEPPSSDNPLFRLPNVVVTPHDASFTHEAFGRMGEHMVHNIRDVLEGRVPTWPVNRPEAPRA